MPVVSIASRMCFVYSGLTRMLCAQLQEALVWFSTRRSQLSDSARRAAWWLQLGRR